MICNKNHTFTTEQKWHVGKLRTWVIIKVPHVKWTAFLAKLKVAINEGFFAEWAEFPNGKNVKKGGSNTIGIKPL